MEVTYELTPDDLWSFQVYYRRHKASIRLSLLYTFAGVLGIVFIGGLLAIVESWLKTHQIDWAMLFLLAGATYFTRRFLPPTKARAIKLASQKPGFFCEHIVSVSPEWLAEKTSVHDAKVAWTTLHSLEEDQSHFYFFTSKISALIIPKRAFSGPHEAEAFLNTARLYWNAAKNGTPLAAEDTAVWPPAPRQQIDDRKYR